jgi:hypothetical protein
MSSSSGLNQRTTMCAPSISEPVQEQNEINNPRQHEPDFGRRSEGHEDGNRCDPVDRPPFPGRPSLTGNCGHGWTCAGPAWQTQRGIKKGTEWCPGLVCPGLVCSLKPSGNGGISTAGFVEYLLLFFMPVVLPLDTVSGDMLLNSEMRGSS